MDWKSKRVRAIIESALAEDKAANDVTTALTIPPRLRATGTIIAKQALHRPPGLGCIPIFFEAFAKMSATPPGRFEIVSHPGDLRRRPREEGPGTRGDPAQRRRDSFVRAGHSEPDAGA